MLVLILHITHPEWGWNFTGAVKCLVRCLDSEKELQMHRFVSPLNEATKRLSIGGVEQIREGKYVITVKLSLKDMCGNLFL